MKVVEFNIDENVANIETIGIFGSYTSSNSSFCYSLKELENNKDSIKKSLENYNIKTINYKDENSFLMTYDLIYPEIVNFDYNNSLSIKVMNKLVKNDNLKQVKCFFMPSNYVHIFSNKNISIIFNNTVSFSYEFTKYNGLNKLKEIYYKKEIYFFTKDEIHNNLQDFLCINKYLKTIHLYCYTNELLKFINRELKKQQRKDVNIIIHFTKSSSIFMDRELAKLLIMTNQTSNNVKINYDEDSKLTKITNNITARIIKVDYALMLCLITLSIMSLEDKSSLSAKVYEEIENNPKDLMDNIENYIDINDDSQKYVKGTLTKEEKYYYINMVKIKYPNLSEKRIELISNALDAVGLPYYWGGGHQSMSELIDVAQNHWGKKYCNYDRLCGFDCSGFTRWAVYSVTNKDIMEGQSMINYNNELFTPISKRELTPGDVGMYHSFINSKGHEQTGHVGIFLYEEDGEYYYINAHSTEKGVIISTINRFNKFYKIDL